MADILDMTRKAIEQSGKTRYAISKETGISECQLSLLMKGTRGLRFDTLERLLENLGLEVTIQPKKRRKKRK